MSPSPPATNHDVGPPSREPPSARALLVGRAAVVLLLLMFAWELFGDFVLWAVLGTRFILSPRFSKMESEIGHPFMGGLVVLVFLGMERAVERLRQRQWKPLVIPFFVFIFGMMPAATGCALLARLMARKGIAVLAHPRVFAVCLLMSLIFTCKFKAIREIWRLIKPAFKPQPPKRFVIESE